MPESIFKLQPDRTVHLRGFDQFGAAAAITGASATGFTASGVFRDPADFAVVVLYDADNFFEHPRLKYLPDFNFDGLVLQFDVNYQGLMPLDCRKYATVDWPYLDVISADGGTHRIRLADYASNVGAANLPASAVFTISGTPVMWDRVTLWYQNLAFDYIVSGKTSTVRTYYAGTPGTIHSVLVDARSYLYVEQAGDTSGAVCAHLAAAINAAPDPAVTATAGPEPGQLTLQTKLSDGSLVTISGSGGESENLQNVTIATVRQELAKQINQADYAGAQTPFSLRAEVVGEDLRITTVEGGYDADFITMYATHKTATLTASPASAKFAGGESRSTLRVRLDFTELQIPQIRQMWLTLAPRLADGKAYESTEWQAVFSNWSVTGPAAVRQLQVAGLASTRVASLAPACVYQGAWSKEEGFYTDNMASRAYAPSSSVTIRYTNLSPHDLWVGTALGINGGVVSAQLDGQALPPLDTRLDTSTEVVTRRRLATGVAPGDHVVKLTLSGVGQFLFDFLEAAVPGDVPEPAAALTQYSPALDYSTDHTYKLSPQRLLWIFRQLGFAGPMNEYIGVFWWNQRKCVGASMPSVQITFGGTFADGDQIIVKIGDQPCGKSVFPQDTLETIASHFAYLINATYVGVWAQATEETLTITARSASAAYRYQVQAAVTQAAGSSGTADGGGWLENGVSGTWVVDADADPPLNRVARDWHADFYRECKAQGRSVTSAASMELVNPPDAFAARFPDGAPVVTDVGFGGLHSTHCAFRSEVRAYHGRVFLELASLMSAAGLTPELQFGEYSWWYFSNRTASNPNGGMAYYDSETAAAARSALGRPLAVFREPDDDPTVNNSADAVFLRNRLRDHVAGLISTIRGAYPAAKLEVLYPYDVNYPTPSGIHQLGGRMNRFVSLPVEWTGPGCGLDRFKLEALDFGAWCRNLDLMRLVQKLPSSLGWTGPQIRMMTPIFKGGYAWWREAQDALGLGFNAVNLWAFDHVCLYNMDLTVGGQRRASRQG